MSHAPRRHRFSVVLPVRNGEMYLADALESILSQTLQDLRILVLENASQDRTIEIAQSFADPRIAILPANEPLSIEANWARIVDLDLDEFVTFISHDDLLYPEFLEEIAQLIDAEPDASLYQTGYHIIDADGRHIRDARIGPRHEDAYGLITATHRFERDMASVGYAVRSKDFKAVGGFPNFPGLLFSDLILWYRLTAQSYQASSPRRLAAFRQHTHNATRASDLCQYYEASRLYLAAARQVVPARAHSDEELGLRFVRGMNSMKHRQILEDIMREGSPEDVTRYQAERDRLKLLASQTPELDPFDSKVRLYEVIASIPSRFVQQAALGIVSTCRAIIRRLRSLIIPVRASP